MPYFPLTATPVSARSFVHIRSRPAWLPLDEESVIRPTERCPMGTWISPDHEKPKEFHRTLIMSALSHVNTCDCKLLSNVNATKVCHHTCFTALFTVGGNVLGVVVCSVHVTVKTVSFRHNLTSHREIYKLRPGRSLISGFSRSSNLQVLKKTKKQTLVGNSNRLEPWLYICDYNLHWSQGLRKTFVKKKKGRKLAFSCHLSQGQMEPN